MIARAATLCLAGLAAAQDMQWQVPTSLPRVEYYYTSSFADFNGDGYRDILADLLFDSFGSQILTHRILSGLDGTTLWERRESTLANLVDAGDVDGDGIHDILTRRVSIGSVGVWSVGAGQWLWQDIQYQEDFGQALLGDLDLDGDGRPDAVTTSIGTLASEIFAYNGYGQLLYRIPLLAQGMAAESLAKMGDMDGDSCDDFIAGCQDVTGRGRILLISGRTGTILRTSWGLLPGDIISSLASNMGDLDGDGINDYAGFPFVFAQRAMITAFSGQTGAVIRTWPYSANSAVTGEDIDLDGVPDLIVGEDYIVATNVRGRTIALSGRDSTELWRVDNFMPPPGSTYINGSGQWMWTSGSLGTPPGQSYPVIAWMDVQWQSPMASGRVRAYSTARAGQGQITGSACSSTGVLPQIGVRQTPTGARFTIAKGPAGGIAWLCLSLASETSFGGAPLPIDLSIFGLPGCSLQVAPTASSLHVLGTQGIDRGYAASDQPFGLTAAAVGVPIVGQWLVLDSSTLGFALTRVHHIRAQ
jgi:hypothetical protein